MNSQPRRKTWTLILNTIDPLSVHPEIIVSAMLRSLVCASILEMRFRVSFSNSQLALVQKGIKSGLGEASVTLSRFPFLADTVTVFSTRIPAKAADHPLAMVAAAKSIRANSSPLLTRFLRSPDLPRNC